MGIFRSCKDFFVISQQLFSWRWTMKIRTLKLASYEKTCRLFTVFCLLLFFGTSVFAGPHEIEGLFDTLTSATSGSYGKETYVGCPISASNGAYFFSKPLFSLGGPMGFRADLLYRSSHGGGFPFPRGFLLNLLKWGHIPFK